MRAIVIHSPHAGRSDRLQEALGYLAGQIQIVSVLPISELDHLPAQGAIWQASGIELVIAAGGDGLIGSLIAHVVETAIPLGILPLGTANDIARSLGIAQELRAAAATLLNGQVQAIDIGMVQHVPDAATPAGYFAHALTIGLNVQFARIATNIAIRQRYGRLTYPFAALEVLTRHTSSDVTITFDGLVPAPGKTLLPDQFTAGNPIAHFRALQTTVINAPIFGGQWQIALPHAALTDHLLDIIVVEDIDLETLKNALHEVPIAQQGTDKTHSLLSADLSVIPGVHHFQASGISISTESDPQDATLDGEVRCQTPLSVRLAETRLRVLAPLHSPL